MDNVKKINMVREFIAGILVVVLYNLHPELLSWNYVILTSMLFGATIARKDATWKKFFSVPSVFYFGITLVMICGLVSAPLSIQFVVTMGTLAGVKEAKAIVVDLMKKRVNK